MFALSLCIWVALWLAHRLPSCHNSSRSWHILKKLTIKRIKIIRNIQNGLNIVNQGCIRLGLGFLWPFMALLWYCYSFRATELQLVFVIGYRRLPKETRQNPSQTNHLGKSWVIIMNGRQWPCPFFLSFIVVLHNRIRVLWGNIEHYDTSRSTYLIPPCCLQYTSCLPTCSGLHVLCRTIHGIVVVFWQVWLWNFV